LIAVEQITQRNDFSLFNRLLRRPDQRAYGIKTRLIQRWFGLPALADIAHGLFGWRGNATIRNRNRKRLARGKDGRWLAFDKPDRQVIRNHRVIDATWCAVIEPFAGKDQFTHKGGRHGLVGVRIDGAHQSRA